MSIAKLLNKKNDKTVLYCLPGNADFDPLEQTTQS